jgi:hypothetical protein
VTGLCTNFHKIFVVPTCCENVNIVEILNGLPVVRAHFPMKYIGLPLSIWCLRRADFQHLEEKVAGKLTIYNEKLITTADLTALIKSVLASEVIYHLTLLNMHPS